VARAADGGCGGARGASSKRQGRPRMLLVLIKGGGGQTKEGGLRWKGRLHLGEDGDMAVDLEEGRVD